MWQSAGTPASAIDHDDLTLISQVATGDQSAFEVLYQRYFPRLIGYLQVHLRHPTLAEDVCHDVLLAVWQQAGTFRQASRLSTWIYGIAWRQARKADTSNSPPAVQPPIGSNLGSEEALEPEVNLQRHERLQGVAQALAGLPAHLRQPLTLQYIHDYSYEQIASEIGCSEDTVKRRLRQARRCLAVALRQTKAIHPISP